MAGMPSADVPAPVTSPSGDSGDPRVADVRARLDAAYQASATAPLPRSWTEPLEMTVEEAMRSSLIAWMAANRDSDTGAPAAAPPK